MTPTCAVRSIHADVPTETLLEMIDAIGGRAENLDWSTPSCISFSGVALQVSDRALTIEATEEPWKRPHITLQRYDDAIGDAPPHVLLASWRASLAISVHEESPAAEALHLGISKAADLLVATAVAANRRGVFASASSTSFSNESARFVVNDLNGPLLLRPRLLTLVERIAPSFRIMAPGLRMVTTTRFKNEQRIARDMDPLKLLRLVADVPEDLVEEMRRTQNCKSDERG